jgi:hypothetical protein
MTNFIIDVLHLHMNNEISAQFRGSFYGGSSGRRNNEKRNKTLWQNRDKITCIDRLLHIVIT